MKTHYAKCLKQSHQELAMEVPHPDPVPVDSPNTASLQKRPLALCDPVPEPSPKRWQDDLKGHVMRTSQSNKEELDDTIAEFVYGCNLPFTIVEHDLFKTMIRKLRPGYKPPTREALRTKHLDSVHCKLQAHMKTKLNNKIVTMQQDGWSTVQNDPVIATSVTCEGKGYFVDAKDTGTMQKTAENCKAMILDSRDTAEQSYGCKVKTFVTDNARNMEKMRNELENDDDSVVTYGCLAHVLNLLGQDITPQALIKHITEINKFFRNHHVPSAWLKSQLGATRPQLPSETRWKGQLMCLDSYIKNRVYYMQFIQDHPSEIDQGIARKVMDMNLFTQVSDLAEILRPVAKALDRAQNDKTNLADACDIFFSLQLEPTLQDHRAALQKRFDFVIRPCHLVAYMFHPKYLGEQLSQEQVEIAREWLLNKGEDFLPAAIAFQAEAAPFPESYFRPEARLMDPVTWWKAMGSRESDLPEGFVDLMVTLQSACASSAALERCIKISDT